VNAYRWLALGTAAFGCALLVTAGFAEAEPAREFMLGLVGGIALGSALAIYVTARRYGQ